MGEDSKNVVFFSSCPEQWGGSEELWGQTAEILAGKGYKIHVFRLSVDYTHPQVKKLSAAGCRITDLNTSLWRVLRRAASIFFIRKFLARKVRQLAPRLFVVSQGVNFDALHFIKECPLDEIPYVLISQKATDSLWARDLDREWMKMIWRKAEKSFFVSEHNLRLTEEQFGLKIGGAEVVRNPFLTKTPGPLPWEFSARENVRLACVGRLFPQEKGQDILLRVLAAEKWRGRKVEVSFFGKGINEQGLKDLANHLGLSNVFFKGHVSDINAIWREHQALVLPSRTEGLPLVLVEAMHCGRPAIVTDVGGNAEVLEDDRTGFIARSADERGFDEALERAWRRLGEWESIGKLAAGRIRTLVPDDPAAEFAENLIRVAERVNSPRPKGT